MKSPRILLVAVSLLTLSTFSRAEITGHWSFEAADLFLSAKIGLPMIEIDTDTAINEEFGTTGQGTFASIPNIGGQAVKVMKFPKTSPGGGYYVPPGTLANGGGTMINQYTIIADLLYPAASSGKLRALFQTDASGDAEFFVNAANQISNGGSLAGGSLTPDAWHRIAIAVDLAALPPSVAFFIDGTKVTEDNPGSGLDGRFAIQPPDQVSFSRLYFANDDTGDTEIGYLSSVQFRDERVPDAVIAVLGSATPDGILTGPLPDPYLLSATPSPESTRIPERSTVSPRPLIQAVIVDGTNAVNVTMVAMVLNGASVGASAMKSGANTTVSFTPAGFLPPLSINTVQINYKGMDGTTYSNRWQFVVGRYQALAASAAGPPGSANTPGFLVRTVQAPNDTAIPNVNTLPRAIQQLNRTLTDTGGVLVANVALPGPNPNGGHNADTINYHLDGSMFGNFDMDQLFPGVPGSDGGNANFSTEVLAFLELPAGTHRLGVSVSVDRTDTGTDDGFQLYVGTDARNILTPVVGAFARNVANAFASTYNNNEFTIVAPVAGVYPFRLVHFQTLQDASLEFYSLDGTNKIPINGSGPGGGVAPITAYRFSTAAGANKPYLAEVSPAPGVSGVAPTLPITALIIDDMTAVNPGSVQLALNGAVVPAVAVKIGGRTSVTYQPNATRSEATNNVRLIYADNAGTPGRFTNDWSFTIAVNTAGQVNVAGQWDFESCDLSATLGAPLEYFGGLTGQTASGARYGITGVGDFASVPPINGQAAKIIRVPGTGNNQIGLIMRHGIPANGGGARVNQYTLIMDIYFPSGPENTFASFLNCDLSNNSDGDMFLNAGNGLWGQGGPGYAGNAPITLDAWHRVAFAVDMGAAQPIVTKYLNGRKHADQLQPNNTLDGDRRSLQVGGAVLFGDGDDGERRTCYVNSIQIRASKLSDGDLAALGGPSADGIPLVVPATTVTGQWNFDAGSLAENIGRPLEYFDGPAGQTASGSAFGTTGVGAFAAIPNIGGTPANVMLVAGAQNNQIGLVMRHLISANGGGSRVNQYTLIMDLYFPSGAGNTFASFLNCDLSNASDGDMFLNAGNGLWGQGGPGYAGNAPITLDAWHRVAFAVDMGAAQPIVTKYLDGQKHADQLQPNNTLDGDRRSLPVGGAVLFGDGDDGERRPLYLNSIQIRSGKLSDAELAALGGPSADGIPVVIPKSTVTGQWNFDAGNLAENIGRPLEYFDGPAGQTASGSAFGTTGVGAFAAIPNIGGVPANVMLVAGAQNNQIGLVMRHLISANGGGSRVNQYTLIMDLYFPSGAGNTFASFLNCDLSNASDGDMFLNSGNGLWGQGGPGYAGNAPITLDAWHRVAFAVDMAAAQPVVTKFRNGVKHADQFEPNNILNGDRRSLEVGGAVLFGDGDDGERRPCYLNSVQIRTGKLSDAELAALGGPSAGGIPVVINVPSAPPVPRLSIARSGNNVMISWPAALTGFRLECTTSLTNPVWQNVPDTAGNCATLPLSPGTRFYRLANP